MTKNEFRTFFAGVKPYIKISAFLDQIGIARTTFSLFMRGEAHNYQISLDRLQVLYDAIVNFCENIA